jgi:integrase
LGFALVQAGRELRHFARYAGQMAPTGPLTAALAIQWAGHSPRGQRSYLALRLGLVRRFAQFWLAYDPRTEVPTADWFGPLGQRRAVHIYTPQEIGALLAAIPDLGHVHPLRGKTFGALIGLLDCTGLRIGEALRLGDADIDWTGGILTVRQAKGGHARLIPVQPSTLEALRRYRALRNSAIGTSAAPRFFVTFRGQALGYFGVSAVFRRLCRHLGWTQAPVPRLHDLRHTFAVRTLLAWYRSDEPIGPRLWTLSTYLGHRHLADTYWYLTAVPELMQLCQARFATAQAWASGGLNHD